MSSTGAERCDVAIIGGGLVGASLAVALTPLGLNVVLVDAQPLDAGTPPNWDERCIAINAGSRAIFESYGLWGGIAAAVEPILSTHISERGRFGVARFSAEDAGLPALGYNTPLRALGQAFAAKLEDLPGLRLLRGRLQRLAVSGEQAELQIAEGATETTLSARLVVAADGARSSVREQLGIEAETRDYRQHAIVTAVRPQRAHGGVAYERFLPGGPIALLPKPDDADGHVCSLVWTVPAERSRELLGLGDGEFMACAHEEFGERLGRFLALGKRQSYPLTRVMSERLNAPRVVFIGNAAQSLHPVAAQGFNLGLRDVAELADALRDADDPGAPALLAAYAASRERDREDVAGFTDRLVRTFSNSLPGFSALRHLGLLALDLTPPLKQAVMWRNLGGSRARLSAALPGSGPR